MKIKNYIERLENSDSFKEFQKKHKDAFIIAGFFIFDLETKQDIKQIDYYVPSEKKIAAFTLGNGSTMQMLNAMTSVVPEKLDEKAKIDLDALHGILKDEMKNRNITEEIKKIIAILQTIEGKRIWNLNCVLSGMEILKAHVEDETQSVLKMEKVSLFDIMKKMPQFQLERMKGAAGRSSGAEGEMPAPADDGGEIQEEPPEILKQKIKKLNMLEKAIEKQKQEAEIELIREEKAETLKKEKSKAKPKAVKLKKK